MMSKPEQKYALTERGRLLIAMIIMFILILPSLIIVFWLFTQNSSSNESNHSSNAVSQNNIDTTDSESAHDTAPDSSQAATHGDNDGSLSKDQSLSGLRAFDIDAGVIKFLFTPDSQTALDDDTTSTIGQLLASPKITNDSKVTVEIPQLSDDKMAIITTAIIDAFNSLNVPLSEIVFFVYEPDPDIETYEIRMSII